LAVTPSIEVPFAGHPNIGTAFVLGPRGVVAVPLPVSVSTAQLQPQARRSSASAKPGSSRTSGSCSRAIAAKASPTNPSLPQAGCSAMRMTETFSG
jgi:predicted PhzF superfamily epimerase YddE/YHI9